MIRIVVLLTLVVAVTAFCCDLVDSDAGSNRDLGPVGTLVDADVVATSFNESMKMAIKTEKQIFVIRGIGHFYRGEELRTQLDWCGRLRLCTSISQRCYEVVQ